MKSGILFQTGVSWSKAWGRLLVLLLIIAAIVGLPFVVGISVARMVIEFAILALFATAYNLALGQTGLFSFGHGGLFGFAVYALVLPVIKADIPMVFAFIGATVMTGLISMGMGWLSLRLTGIYFGIITLAFGQLIWVTAWKWRSLTGGDDGIIGLQIPSLIASPTNMYFLVLAIVIAAMVMIWMITNSPLGFTFKMIRENPRRAESVGVNVKRYQLIAFTLSGLFTGVAGSLYAIFIRGAFVEFAFVGKGFEPVFANIVGGLYVFMGPTVGAGLLLALGTYISRVTEYWMFFSGAILVLSALFLPSGMVGSSREWILRWVKKR